MITDYDVKRSGQRIKNELIVGVKTTKTNSESKLAYTVDLSRGGMKIASPMLFLSVGEQLEVIVTRAGEKVVFSGDVKRKDGIHFIDRIRRSGNAYFIGIEDSEFHKFVADNFYIF